jgi:hypothetical protein
MTESSAECAGSDTDALRGDENDDYCRDLDHRAHLLIVQGSTVPSDPT